MTSGFSRRAFLKSSGVMIVGLSGMHRVADAQLFGGPVAASPPLNQLDSWIAIAADGSVTAFSGKEELGQGISVAQMQLVAEELSVPFDRVKLIYCDTAFTPDQAYTSGSQSHPANFNHDNLAQQMRHELMSDLERMRYQCRTIGEMIARWKTAAEQLKKPHRR